MSTKIKTPDGWKDVTRLWHVPKPDWDNAVNITLAEFNAGYTCPAEGILVGFCGIQGGNGSSIKINGIHVAAVPNYGSVQCQVNKGDVVTNSGNISNCTLSFVPYK